MNNKNMFNKSCVLIITFFLLILLTSSGCTMLFGNTDNPTAEPGKAIEGSIDKAQSAACQANIAQIKSALAAYNAENGSYPASLSAVAPRYIPSIPEEPQDGTYNYNPSTGKVTCSLGHNQDDQ